jgi:hypothetical protein
MALTRRTFLAQTAAVLAAPLAAEAQKSGIYRVGVVSHGGLYGEAIDGLRDGLRQSGLEEGKQVVLHVRQRRGRFEVGGGGGEKFLRGEG